MTHKVAFSFADGKTLFCAAQNNEILLDAALRSGIKIPLDCREGVCATCQARCESGQYTQDYVDEEALSLQDLAQGKVLTCQTRVQSDATFYFDFDSTLCSAEGPRRVQSLITRVELVSQTTAVLHVDAGQHPQQLDYLPGQYARLHIPETDEWRSYSFASRPSPDNKLQFLVRLLPQGVMSDFMRDRCHPGQELEFEAPLGSFYLRQITRPLYLVAGGTGLSAFLGMLDELAIRGTCGQPVRLFYGVTLEADLCEVERLLGYCDQIADFDVQVVVSRPSTTWSGKCGWIPEHFDRDALGAGSFDMYVCGPPPMVEAIKGWLNEENVQGGNLYYEKFVESNSSR